MAGNASKMKGSEVVGQALPGTLADGVPESFTAGRHLTTSAGKRVKRWGKVKDACMILDGCDPTTVHNLIHAKVVIGYRLNPRAKHSHFRVDLLSVWNHRQQQLTERDAS